MHGQWAILDWRVRSRVDFLERHVHAQLIIAIILRPKQSLCFIHGKWRAKLFFMVAVENEDVIIRLLGGRTKSRPPGVSEFEFLWLRWLSRP